MSVAETMYSLTLKALQRDYGDKMPKWATRPFGEKITGDDRYEHLELLAGAMALKTDQRWLWLEQARETVEIELKYEKLLKSNRKLSAQVVNLQEALSRR